MASGSAFPSQGKFTIIIDSEILLVTGVSGTTWTVERGHDGTTAAAHNNNSIVTQILTVDSFLNAHHFDVRAYGAKGDGTTDDRAAIQAAMDAAAAAGGGTVFFPIGTYLIGSAVTFGANGIRMVGASPRKSQITVAFSGPGIDGDGTRRFNCSIENLAIVGSGAIDLVRLRDMDMFYMANSWVQSCDGTGINVTATVGSTRNLFVGVHVLGCATRGIDFGSLSNSCRVIGGEFQGNGIGIDITGGSTANNIAIYGAIVESTTAGATGIRVAGENASIDGCRMELSGDAAIGLDLTASAGNVHVGPGNYYSVSPGTPINDSAPSHQIHQNKTSPFIRHRTDKTASGLGTDVFEDIEAVDTLTGNVNDGFAAAIALDPAYTAGSAFTVARHNYLNLENPSGLGAGPAAITHAALARFDAVAGTHKAVDAGTTKTSPGTVNAWVKINIAGTIYYIPAYTSKTT